MKIEDTSIKLTNKNYMALNKSMSDIMTNAVNDYIKVNNVELYKPDSTSQKKQKFEHAILQTLCELDKSDFISTITDLLETFDVINVSAMRESSDDFFEGYGLFINVLIIQRIHFQCIRNKDLIDTDDINDFREVLNQDCKGIIITTGDCTADAGDLSQRYGIRIIKGAELASFLLNTDILK